MAAAGPQTQAWPQAAARPGCYHGLGFLRRVLRSAQLRCPSDLWKPTWPQFSVQTRVSALSSMKTRTLDINPVLGNGRAMNPNTALSCSPGPEVSMARGHSSTFKQRILYLAWGSFRAPDSCIQERQIDRYLLPIFSILDLQFTCSQALKAVLRQNSMPKVKGKDGNRKNWGAGTHAS